MKERTRKILIIIGLIISSVYVISQFLYFFEDGPSGVGGLPLLLIAIFIGTILLSRKFLEEYFKSKQILTVLLAFMLLAIILDIFYEIAFQIDVPIHPILWIDLLIRFTFFIPWIHMWLIFLYYCDVSVKVSFYLAAIQGIVIEYLLVLIFTNETHRVTYYILNYGFFSILMIPFDIFVCILLYGSNIAVPYSPFRKILKERLNQREIKPIIKYTLSFIPVIAFPLALFLLQNFVVHIIVALA